MAKAGEKVTDSDIERFNSHVVANKENGCWEWFGSRSRKGYGFIRHKKRLWQTHRFVWFALHGDIPSGMYICHKCDNPRCCNPEHLFLGTSSENAKDAFSKNRRIARRGELNGGSKLNDAKVREILSMLKSGEKKRTIARRFGIGVDTIILINLGRRWAHVTIDSETVNHDGN